MKTFLLTLLLILVIDFVWLGLVAKNFYKREIGFKRIKNWPVALIIYILLAIGITVFVNPKTFLMGALFGLIIYAVYDLTNFITLDSWSIKLVLVDILWGALLCGSISYLISKISLL